jgi:hypothetical protein
MPNLEHCQVSDGEVRFLWLLPISKDERDFRKAHGTGALEKIFDDRGIEYWNPRRESVVQNFKAEYF